MVYKLAILLTLCEITATGARSEQIGHWLLEIDPMTEMIAKFREDVEAARAPIILQAASFDLKYDGDGAPSDPTKRATAARWSRVIIDALKLSGLRTMDGPGVTPQQRQQIDEMRQKMIERMPFGMRSQARSQIGDIVLLFDDRVAPCARIDGAYAAFIMMINPQSGVASDYGSIGVFAIGMGACGERGGYAERRLGSTLNRAHRALIRDLWMHGAEQ
jgi:hypothetical protein